MASPPSAEEQLLLELINRFRSDPGSEAARWTGANAPEDVRTALAYFGVSDLALFNQLAGLAPVAPLAWNDTLSATAEAHNAAMIAANEQTHQAPGEASLAARIGSAGYNYRSINENVYAYASNATYAHAAFVVDWGYDAGEVVNGTPLPLAATTGDGIQDPPAHRAALMDAAYTEVGIATSAAAGGANAVGPLVVTQDFGSRFGYQPQFVGSVINDSDHDHFYDIGEGVGGVLVTLKSSTGAVYTTTTWDSGGWQIAVPNGIYSISFASGSFSGVIRTKAVLDGANVQVDAETSQASTTVPARHDFNGDGRSDIVWREANGAFSDWLGQPNGGFTGNDAHAFHQVDPRWSVAGVGDFNGDGRDDVLWRNVDGTLSDWLGASDGTLTVNDVHALSQVDPSWTIAGVGDFNGDGRDDIVWRHVGGAISDWLGRADGGFTVNDGAALGSPPTDWHIVGVGDFNGDGLDDLLWRRDNGDLSDWLGGPKGTWAVNDGVAFRSVPTDWKVAGTGDFNGDGRVDILWRNDNGDLSDWLGGQNGAWVANDANVYRNVPTGWTIVDTGDFNGDGRDDILWRNANGALSDWLANASGGFIPNDAQAYQLVGTNWTIQGSHLLM